MRNPAERYTGVVTEREAIEPGFEYALKNLDGDRQNSGIVFYILNVSRVTPELLC
jgi:hypothetical protein